MLMALIAVPICGKTIRSVGSGSSDSDWYPLLGWGLLVAVPLALGVLGTVWLISQRERQSGGRFSATALLFTTVLYFVLNSVLCDWAWPWNPEWTDRTPNQTIFMVFAGTLCVAALISFLISPKAETG